MKKVLFFLMLMLTVCMQAAERQKLNFNADWRLAVGDFAEAMKPEFDDGAWQRVTLPYSFNGDEAFRKDIVDLTDTICWYRKVFRVESRELKEGIHSTLQKHLVSSCGKQCGDFFAILLHCGNVCLGRIF